MSFSVNVDPTNPGQFFACCGLLELADRLWPGAEGWFADGQFHVNGDADLHTLLAVLVMDPPEEIRRMECNGLAVKPLIAPLRYSFDGGATTGIVLDAWTTIRLEKGEPAVVANPPWNFWSGQQTSAGIWAGLRKELAPLLNQLSTEQFADLFSQRLFQKGRFGFDPGPAWNALDVGFSPNEQSMEVESSPAVELLAAVGLQRFRPVSSSDRECFMYTTWTVAFPPEIAAAAMSGAIISPGSIRYRASVVSRGQYAALGTAYPIREGDTDE